MAANMATTHSEVKHNGRDQAPARTHRELLERALMVLAEREREADPSLSFPRAYAQAMRHLGAEIRVKRRAVARMREVGRVARYHWPGIERATGGKVTEAEFERATYD